MVRVDSADAMAERVKALGGTAQPAFDVGPAGRMADCHDPNGANIDLWQPGQSQGMEADSTQHGVPSWFETMTSDTDRATKFYTELFGWTAEENAVPGMQYTSFTLGGEYVAGMMQITPDMPPMPSHWGTYFTVTNADQAAQAAAALGGTVFIPVSDIPGTGRFCGIVSPQGVRFYLLEYAS